MNLKEYNRQRDRQRKASEKRAKETDKQLLSVSGHDLLKGLYATARKTNEPTQKDK